MGINYCSVDELIDVLKGIDKRKTRHSPYISDIGYNYQGNIVVTLVPKRNGGLVKRVILNKEEGNAKANN